MRDPLSAYCSYHAQVIGNWFGNEAKAVTGQANTKSSKSTKGVSNKNISKKHWNHRTVAAELHSNRLNEIKEQLVAQYTGDGIAAMRTYANAVTTLVNELSEEEVQQCREVAEEWNRKTPPAEIQRKCVWTFYRINEIILITPFKGQPSVSMPRYRDLSGQLNVRWESTCLFSRVIIMRRESAAFQSK